MSESGGLEARTETGAGDVVAFTCRLKVEGERGWVEDRD